MLVDSHCHLDAPEFDADRGEIIAASAAAGVGAIIVPAVAVEHFSQVVALAGEHATIYYALGIHPMYVDAATTDNLIRLRAALERYRDDPKLLAVGEIGLDFFVPGLDRAKQIDFYEAQLRLAREFELPVILHVRRSQDQILKYLRRIQVSGGIAHAFNGSTHQALEFCKLNFVLGFGGAMTFTRALQIRRLASELPADAHVLETDSPDIAPSWLHPGRNTPLQLPQIAQTLAGLRGIDTQACIEQSFKNLRRVLTRLPGQETTHQGRPKPATGILPI